MHPSGTFPRMRIFFERFKKARKKMGIISSSRYKLIGSCGSTAKRPFQKKVSPDGQKIELNFGFLTLVWNP